MHDIINYIIELIGAWGYFGIFFLMFLESTIVPIPSELVVPPAGYLVSKGEMSMVLVILAGTLGSLGGAMFNYIIAKKYGRGFVLYLGKFFFFDDEKLKKVDAFFLKHGSFSTFTGRLIPGVRHLISIPAGLCSMSLSKFIGYTTLGSFIWVTILAIVGYVLGENEKLIAQNMHQITIITLVVIALGTIVYIYWHKKSNF